MDYGLNVEVIPISSIFIIVIVAFCQAEILSVPQFTGCAAILMRSFPIWCKTLFVENVKC